MTSRPCLDCGVPSPATRCPSCQAERDARTDVRRGSRTERGYDAAWARLSRRARRLQPWCLDCGSTDDLTADHKVWPARSLAEVDVVCRSCNSKRGAARGANPRTTPPTPPFQRHGALLSPPGGDAA